MKKGHRNSMPLRLERPWTASMETGVYGSLTFISQHDTWKTLDNFKLLSHFVPKQLVSDLE